MVGPHRHALRRFLGFVCLLLVVTFLLALLGWPPTRKLAGSPGVTSMLAAIALSCVASLAGGLPILRIELRGERPRIAETMGSLVIRLFLVLAGIAYVLLVGGVERAPFLLWVGISYVLLLPVDIRYLIGGGSRVEDER